MRLAVELVFPQPSHVRTGVEEGVDEDIQRSVYSQRESGENLAKYGHSVDESRELQTTLSEHPQSARRFTAIRQGPCSTVARAAHMDDTRTNWVVVVRRTVHPLGYRGRSLRRGVKLDIDHSE